MFEPFKDHLNFFFVVGTFEDSNLTIELDFESAAYNDILQVSLEDGYKNLIYKVLAAYLWVYENRSPTLQWVASMDDDLHLEVSEFLRVSQHWKNDSKFLICNSVYRNFATIRGSNKSLNNKW